MIKWYLYDRITEIAKGRWKWMGLARWKKNGESMVKVRSVLNEDFGLLIGFETAGKGFLNSYCRSLSLFTLLSCIAANEAASLRITFLQVSEFHSDPSWNSLINAPIVFLPATIILPSYPENPKANFRTSPHLWMQRPWNIHIINNPSRRHWLLIFPYQVTSFPSSFISKSSLMDFIIIYKLFIRNHNRRNVRFP